MKAESYFNIIAIISTLLCLSPFMVSQYQSNELIDNNTNNSSSISEVTVEFYDDYAPTFYSNYFRDAAIAAFVVTIAPLVDAFIDLIPLIFPRSIISILWFNCNDRKNNQLKCCRLSAVERLLFYTGICFLSIWAFALSNQSYNENIMDIYGSLTSISAVFMTTAILRFLHRHTEVWTFNRTLVVLLISHAGSVLGAFSYTPILDEKLLSGMMKTATVCMFLTFFLTIFASILCLYKYFREHGYLLFRIFRADDDAVDSTNSLNNQTTTKALKDMHENFVPAMHMISLLIGMGVDCVWYYVEGPNDRLLSTFVWCLVVEAVIVTVTETRIRYVEAFTSNVRNPAYCI